MTDRQLYLSNYVWPQNNINIFTLLLQKYTSNFFRKVNLFVSSTVGLLKNVSTIWLPHLSQHRPMSSAGDRLSRLVTTSLGLVNCSNSCSKREPWMLTVFSRWPGLWSRWLQGRCQSSNKFTFLQISNKFTFLIM